MENDFNNFIKLHNLTNNSEKILVGLSGGRDSIFMASLFLKFNYKIAIAHCNFSLRGNESDNEQKFVENFAKNNDVQFFTTKFNTKKYAEEKNISIQMAARELRYNWFEKIRLDYNFNKIAIAHNKNDSIETFFINLIRGTGIKGLTGIKPINGNIIRPILFADRNYITNFLVNNNILWKDDSSNTSDKYLRNNIRLNIIPKFEEIAPDFISKMEQNIELLSSINDIYEQEIKRTKDKILLHKNGSIFIDIELLTKLKPLKPYLYEFIKNFNFSTEQTDEVLEIINSISGKQIISKTHRLIKDRNNLIITELNTAKLNDEFEISEGILEIKYPIKLQLDLLNNKNTTIIKTKNTANLNYEKLIFPLKLRHWIDGDKFMPFGMNKFKKLSNYFSDNKFSILDKENTWVLTDNENNIIWIVNNRIDNRFKITEKTEKILQISYFNNK